MKIYGKVWPWYETQRYELGVERDDEGILYRQNGSNVIAGCSGKATQFLEGTIGDYGNVNDVMSWGYEGRGSDLLAGWLIMRAMHPYGIMDESRHAKPNEERRQIMLRHYKQFSTEVIANLPDEWEMDTEWVKEWVMEREKTEVKA